MGKPTKSPHKAEASQSERFMVSGLISLRGAGESSLVAVRRGMLILTREGVKAGQVAAVAFEHCGGKSVYILQCSLPDSPDYRKVALDFIERVSEDAIHLTLSAVDFENIPRWRSRKT